MTDSSMMEEMEPDAPSELVTIHWAGPDEVVAFGPPEVVRSLGEVGAEVPAAFLAAAQRLAAATPELQGAAQAVSGRWVKLSKESAAALRTHGGTAAPNGGIYGVVRSADGRVAQHLTFVDPATASKLLVALPSLAGAVALHLQQARIEQQLEAISEDLGYVVDHLHDSTLAELAANAAVLDQVFRAAQLHGELDDDHWQMVANLAQPVTRAHELTTQRLGSLRAVLADDSAGLGTRVKTLNRALHRDRTVFWLQAHVHAELALSRWQALYLMRRAEQRPDTLAPLVEEYEAQWRERHAMLRGLAVGLARYLQTAGRTESLLERVRIISRYKLDRLLTELEQILAIYREEVRAAGWESRELEVAPVAGALPPPDEDEREWLRLLDQLGEGPRVAGEVGRKVAGVPRQLRDRFRKDGA
ncbi:MAG TPA: hypothetical protein VK866_05390, partial [Acidimicrobiales bacterium]|nr:hypothetical protein [Acidimicrobiales bacterium]